MIHNKSLSSNNVETTVNANPEEETTMTNKNNKMAANVEQNIIGGVNMERVFNEELANIIAEVVGHEMKMEEEVEMKKVSILDRFAAHHNRADKVEVVVEELEEEKEMELSDKKKAIIAKMKEENKVESVKFDIMFAMKEKAAIAEATGVVMFDTTKAIVSRKVNDFFAPKEESSAPVEEVKEDNRTAKELFDSIVERTNVFFPKGAFDAALEEEEQVEEEVTDPAVADILEKMKENNIRAAQIDKELEGLYDSRSQAVEEGMELEDKVAEVQAQLEFVLSQKAARDAGVEEDVILKTKDDIDAYFGA